MKPWTYLSAPLGLILCSAAHCQVTWEVVNRFPLISETAFKALESEVGRKAVGIESRITQVDFRRKVKHLDDRLAWSAGAQAHLPFLLSTEAKVVGRTSMGNAECIWVLGSGGAIDSTTRSSCDASPPISVELGRTYELRVTRTSDFETMTVELTPRRHLVVAIGDSFASGEGNPDYPAEFRRFSRQPPNDWATEPNYPVHSLDVVSARWLDPDCHRSLLSWPALYALRKALTQPNTVVQFASLACSGAEVLDGFLLPQRSPPGRIGVELTSPTSHLRVSQQQGLAELLCRGKRLVPKPVKLQEELRVYLVRYGNKFAKPVFQTCDEPDRPDEVLVQLGGNDAMFGGVVKYVFQPQQLRYRPPFGWFIGTGVNFGLYKALAPVAPQQGHQYIEKLPALYALLSEGLSTLGIETPRTSVRLLAYPDPTVSELAESEQEAALQACNLRTRDGNFPMQSLIAQGLWFLRHDNAKSGVNPRRLIEVSNDYIVPLRKAQRVAAKVQRWELVDSQPALAGHSLCAGSVECEQLGDACPNADRVRWAFSSGSMKYVNAPKSPPWQQIQDFRPYDPLRKRGMRYANDALLTSVRLSGGRVRLDWAAGIAHPTANVHALIAARIGD